LEFRLLDDAEADEAGVAVRWSTGSTKNPSDETEGLEKKVPGANGVEDDAQ
jgi:hypothetical protein